MTVLSKVKVSEIIKNAPKGTDPKAVIDGLTKRGYTLEGFTPQAPVAKPDAPATPTTPTTTASTIKPNEGGVPSFITGIAKSMYESVKKTEAPVIEAAKGAVKGAVETTQNLGNLVVDPLKKLTGDTEKTGFPKEMLDTKNTAQKVGKFSENVAEFFIPGGLEEKAAKYIDEIPQIPKLIAKLVESGVPEHVANFLANTGKLGLKMLTRGVSGGTVAGLQTGDKGAAETTGVVSALLPVGEKILSGVKKVLPDVVSFTSGIKKGAIEEGIKSPKSIEAGIKMTMADIRDKAESELGKLRSDMTSKFSKGLNDLQKKTPTNFIEGKYNAVKQMFSDSLKSIKGGVPAIFRDFAVGVENMGKDLNFNKLNSSIVKPSERSNLQEAWNTIMNQSNFSPKGVQAVASKLEALTKHGENNETSAIITKIKSLYDKAIETHYPDLHALRANYGKTAQALEDIKSVVGSKFDNPKQIQSAVNRLTQIFNADKETYLNVIKDLSEKSGVNFQGLIASDQLKRAMPQFIRGLGGAGVLAAGHFMNPWLYLLAPLFSPKIVGQGIMHSDLFPKAGSVLEPIIQKSASSVGNSTPPEGTTQ